MLKRRDAPHAAMEHHRELEAILGKPRHYRGND